MIYSPLRYPGGKNKLAKFVARLCEENNIHGHYVEPYAGGASVALYLLINNVVSEIIINDIDRSIYAFWYSVVNYTDELCKMIMDTEVNIDVWKNMRDIHKNKSTVGLFELGFSTFFLNRTNISGIIEAGPIGGQDQRGNYKIDCRFNKEDLVNRIQRIATYKNSIKLYNLDAVSLVTEVTSNYNDLETIYYFDPPYYLKGQSLYINSYKHADHAQVSNVIRKIDNARWLVSYDNNENIKLMYDGLRKLEYSFFHTAYEAREGKEILFFSDNMVVPKLLDPIHF